MRLSFFSFANDHSNVTMISDLPSQAESGDVFSVPVDQNSAAYQQIVTKGSQPKKIHNAANAKVTLKAFVCYKADVRGLQGNNQFCCVYDNVPHNHRTVAPVEGEFINCVHCKIGGRLGPEPTTTPSLYDMLGFTMHCFRMRAAAEPRPLHESFNGDVHRLVRVLYRGFDTDCSEDNSMNIVAILRFLDQLDYKLSALKLLKKQCIMELLDNLFLSECIDEEETVEVEAVLSWMRNDFDQ